ncbi:thiamine pyrophosphate-dependent acetolactate synthase large subunit-like protein [Rhodococcus wratislaviensis]|uniref:acetolactate synthase n=1 Tax=Rhodococcus wratislaviensis TaxID=44752 RepID=A0AB38FDC6_RHOWR|nr:thiamine pyrophosphate-binding protein [Rhodococcus wratislaviensis]REE75489.1 thiamine pyrophosphate-dependent acetolactate synthase large subunit-like protein [Rhodococcus wratislaviensis]SPZ39476.1 putative acetyltransferase [Rhodococcus wratislaviensis]
MKVYEALARAFQAEGVTDVFGLMGNANMYWWYAMDQAGVNVHPTRHEGTALSMAEGWARATGQVGCCTVTQGPGVTQLGSALTVASRARIPLVVYGGDSVMGALNGLQYIDQRRFVEATETAFVPLFKAEQVNEVVREAFFIARSQSRPVFLNVPRDLQEADYDESLPEYEPSIAMHPEPQKTLPNPDRLRDAARLLAGSKKPVVVVGRGVDADAEGGVKSLAERVGALIATTLPMKGWGNDSPYYVGVAGGFSNRTAVDLFAEADCVLGVGASLNRHTLQDGNLFEHARYVQIDLRPTLIMGNHRAADVYLQGDSLLTVDALNELLEAEGVASRTGFRTPEVKALLKESDPDPREFELEPDTVDPRLAAALVDKALPAEVGTVLGNGHTSGIATINMTKRRDLQWYISAFGCIGQSLPTAIGGAAASPHPVAVIDGDASVLMHINELETAARMGLKLLVVTLNDQAWGAEYQKFSPKNMDTRTAVIPTPDLGAVARAFGCRGALITELEQIEPAVDEFLRGDGPMLLDIRVSKTVASVPYRRVRFGEHI